MFLIFLDEKNAMRKELQSCMQCEKQTKQIKYLEDQLNKCTVRLGISVMYFYQFFDIDCLLTIF